MSWGHRWNARQNASILRRQAPRRCSPLWHVSHSLSVHLSALLNMHSIIPLALHSFPPMPLTCLMFSSFCGTISSTPYRKALDRKRMQFCRRGGKERGQMEW